MGVDEGIIDDELKLGERLRQCIWAKIKWLGEMKLREKKRGTKMK